MSRLTTQYIDRQVAVLSGKIHVLQRQESELRGLLDALSLEKHALEAERDHLETGSIPFYWLPPELLIHIFVLSTYSVLDPAQSQIDTAPFSISHVCRRWREIALATPVLWRRVVLTPQDISFRHPVSPATQTFLERSKGIPTEVFYAIPSYQASPHDSEPPQPLGSFVLETTPPLALRSLHIHGNHDIISNALSYLHKDAPGLASLHSLELALTSTTPVKLFDGLRMSDPERVYCNPWRTHRFPALQTLTLRDIPVACVSLGQLPALRELTLTLNTSLTGRLEFLRLPYFARLLACAPHVERLSLLRAGPVFSIPLESAARSLEDDPGWRADGSRALPPVPLENLRELEWSDVHPRTLHLLLTHFPTPRLEVMDVAFANATKCKKLAAWLHPAFSDPTDSMSGQPVLELANLKALHIDCSSGDEPRGPFLRLFFPALETLSLSNRNMCVRWAGPQAAEDESHKLPQLPRLESIFRDPRMPRLTHLSLSGFAIPSDQVSSMLGYMPSIQRLECNFIPSVTVVIDTLATARLAGLRMCPRLRHIQLCYCDGVEPVILSRLVKLRNGFESEEDGASCDVATPKRPMKRLPKGPHTTSAGQSPWPPVEEQCVAKVEQVSLEGCLPITREEARSLEQWRVEVDWAPHPASE
ncbi:hypothetical protein EI94DRAFT_1726327 [Lactarius quietus]|nr:hypothetical protein EI94DRAFT_1726327 [Lactarius quietus]